MSNKSEIDKQQEYYKSALRAAHNSIDDWLTSPIREPAVDLLHALKHFLGEKLKQQDQP
jgi:hypothetical protein